MQNPKHCTKESTYAKSDEKPSAEVSKTGNVIPMPNNHFAQSSTKTMPTKPKSADKRSRKYLTADEIKRLREAAKKVGRQGERDSLIILMMYRHGLRVSELCNLKWSQVQLDNGVIHINRAKNGSPSVQPMEGDEIRALRKLQHRQATNPFVFVSERRAPLSTRTVQNLIERAGIEAKIDIPVNAHALRHSCGYALANAGTDTRSIQAYLGHKNIQHTVIYTQLDSKRFNSFGAILGG